jgi:Fe-S-cluster containining protein
VNWILIKAVFKARRKGLFHLVPVTGPTNFTCLAADCAKCCRVIGTPVVTTQEAEKINREWLVRDKNAMFVKSNKSTCCLLKDSLCSIHPDRPKGCREYPWYNIEGRLYFDAGCPGVKHDKNEHPDLDDIQPFENFFPGMPKLVFCLIRKICVK